jgi:hypothetical protein
MQSSRELVSTTDYSICTIGRGRLPSVARVLSPRLGSLASTVAVYSYVRGPPSTPDWRDVGLADRRGIESTPSTKVEGSGSLDADPQRVGCGQGWATRKARRLPLYSCAATEEERKTESLRATRRTPWTSKPTCTMLEPYSSSARSGYPRSPT